MVDMSLNQTNPVIKKCLPYNLQYKEKREILTIVYNNFIPLTHENYY